MKDTFLYNSKTNLKLIQKIKHLDDPTESIRLFSHLINSQIKWMARLNLEPQAPQMSWWDPVYTLDELEEAWLASLKPWLDLIDSKTEVELESEANFIGYDGSLWAVSPKDMALQLNYHSIHHRAQIQTIIRAQGIEPDFVDYIGTKYRKLS